MSPTRTFKLGTRRSLLAWAQSSWVAREIERLNPGARVELVGIDTRGDKILDVPLSTVTGKEFFVAEIDEALRTREVDLTVHSMKDLSLDRPREFKLAAIPRRENPRDVIVFGPRVIERLRAGAMLRIGTSSPRRLENIPPFAEKALPRIGPAGSLPRLEFVEIRGNVNTRLARVREPLESERYLDGVVLAFAGLIRLWADENAGRPELERLLDGARWMVLPLKQCPAAPAQGALAIECRADDAETLAMLAKLHDTRTAESVAKERQLLADWGGGCHQRFGATAIGTQTLGELMYVRGKKPDDSFVEELRWRAPALRGASVKARSWNGMQARAAGSTDEIRAFDLSGQSSLFIAQARALDAKQARTVSPDARVWTSGVASWFKLAELGLWVEGCAESMGFEFLRPTIGEPILRLPKFSDWVVLTHDQAESGWLEGRVISTYKVPVPRLDAAELERLRAATHIFWGSGSQFDALREHASPEAHHACGPGKTFEHLKRAGITRLAAFPSEEEWTRWIES